MTEAFQMLSRYLKARAIKPLDVEMVLSFKNESDRDSIAFALGKEFDRVQKEPGSPSHVGEGMLYGIPFKLVVKP